MDKIKESLKELGVEVVDYKSCLEDSIGVTVMARNPQGMDKVLAGQCLQRETKRKTLMHVHSFKTRKVDDKDLLFFNITTRAPELLKWPSSHCVAMSFIDFCWKLSEGSTPTTAIEIGTPLDLTYGQPGDLTWFLPSKFADDLIEMMYAINADVLSNIMQDAWLYGPVFDRLKMEEKND